MPLLFIQAAVPQASALSIGAWLALIVTLSTLAGGVFKLGALTADGKNLRSSLEAELKSVREVLGKIVEFMEESQRLRQDWAGFRKTQEDCSELHTKEIHELKEADTQQTHKLRNVEQAVALVAARVDVVERRHGPSDRRRTE